MACVQALYRRFKKISFGGDRAGSAGKPVEEDQVQEAEEPPRIVQVNPFAGIDEAALELARIDEQKIGAKARNRFRG